MTMHITSEQASAIMTEYQMPSAPKMAGSRNTHPISKIMDLEKASAADMRPLPNPVNHADVKRFSHENRKRSI